MKRSRSLRMILAGLLSLFLFSAVAVVQSAPSRMPLAQGISPVARYGRHKATCSI